LKKFFPYLIAVLLLTVMIFLFAGSSGRKTKKMDERITLGKADKIPYGTYVAFDNLKYIFPNASIYTDKNEPGYWDSVYNHGTKQAFIAISGRFNASSEEMRQLINFVKSGNDAFISARYISETAQEMLGCKCSSNDFTSLYNEYMDDSVSLSLNKPPFPGSLKYSYPGKKVESYFYRVDTTTTDVLGYNNEGTPNFIHLTAGKGNFYLHLAPLAFSNYFLLHGNNISYYEKALSVISSDVEKVIWDEYYLKKKFADESVKKKNWLSIFFQFPALKAALLTAIFALLLYTLLEMRRKQRYIPVINRPKNDSLDFVKTIGRMYYDKGDHKNLCRKMAAYFLEYIRNRFKLNTNNLDEEFIHNLQSKTAYDENELRSIVSFISHLDEAYEVKQKQLILFHKKLESFYNYKA
jgi:hypothetical protein